MLRPEHLRTLVQVVRLGSFAAAANRLGYTPSAVSQQMAALEHACGVPLFERSAKASSPTPAAHALAERASAVLRDLSLAQGAAREAHHASVRSVRLGTFPSAAIALVPEVHLGLDPHQCAGVWVTVSEPSELVPQLTARGGLDAAVVYRVGDGTFTWPSGLTDTWLTEDRFRVVVPPDWHPADRAAEELDQVGWVMHRPGSSDATVFEAFFDRCGFQPRVAALSDDFNATIAMVRAGIGAALIPDLALVGHHDSVSVLDVPWLTISRSIFALTAADSTRPDVAHVVDGVRRVLEQQMAAQTAAYRTDI